jgi:hypothetical protein
VQKLEHLPPSLQPPQNWQFSGWLAGTQSGDVFPFGRAVQHHLLSGTFQHGPHHAASAPEQGGELSGGLHWARPLEVPCLRISVHCSIVTLPSPSQKAVAVKKENINRTTPAATIFLLFTLGLL